MSVICHALTVCPGVVCDITSLRCFISVFILNPALWGKRLKGYVIFLMLKNSSKFSLNTLLWFGRGIHSFIDKLLFSSYWKSICCSHRWASEKLYFTAVQQHWMLVANSPEDIFLPGLLAAWKVFANTKLPALRQDAWTGEPISPGLLLTPLLHLTKGWKMVGPSSNVIRNEKVVLGLGGRFARTALQSRGRNRRRDARGGESKRICHLL